jgi:hypothetical protein
MVEKYQNIMKNAEKIPKMPKLFEKYQNMMKMLKK